MSCHVLPETCPLVVSLTIESRTLAFFFLSDPAPPEISPLPLHAPLPIFWRRRDRGAVAFPAGRTAGARPGATRPATVAWSGSPPSRSRPTARLRATGRAGRAPGRRDRKSTRLNSSHDQISYAVFCLKKKD